MAYFQRGPEAEGSYTRQFPAAREETSEEWEEEPLYDDGFDELLEEELPEEEEFSEEEARLEKQRRYRIAAGFGDFGATLLGVVVILVLVAFLINMLRFVSSDFAQSFSLWQTKF